MKLVTEFSINTVIPIKITFTLYAMINTVYASFLQTAHGHYCPFLASF